MPLGEVDLQKAVEIARSYGATRVVLFGSYLRNREQARDLDLAVDGVEGWKLYELAARIEEALMVPLDLVPLDPHLPFTRIVEQTGRVLHEQ